MTANDPNATANEGSLAVICGGGSLPIAVAEAARRQGRRVVLFAVHGFANPEFVARFPHHWLYLGQVGRFLRLARAEGCRDVVAIGGLVRPMLRQIRFDLYGLRLLPWLAQAFRQGDNGMLSKIGALFEQHGFHMVGAHEVAPEILMPQGAITRCRPSDRDRSDIRHALTLLHATGPFDVGQAAVVSDNRVLAIEAAEGTDHMLARLADLRREGRIQARTGGGVLVKAPKAGQDSRFDLPSIGPLTVEGAARAGLAGIAVVAGSTVVAEPDRIAAAADRTNIFVVGVTGDGSDQ